MKPTDEQVRKFWEWCGFEECFEFDTGVRYWKTPDGKYDSDLPSPDLNNLFKWAVPKVHACYKANVIVGITAGGEWYGWVIGKYNGEIFAHEVKGMDAATALFLAIEKLIEEGKCTG